MRHEGRPRRWYSQVCLWKQTRRSCKMLNVQNLIDAAKCDATGRHRRWPDGGTCPRCQGTEVTKQGREETDPYRQRDHCKRGERSFDDVTETIGAGPHQPLRGWILGLYVLGLQLSTQPSAQELDFTTDDGPQMTGPRRAGMVQKTPSVTLSAEVDCAAIDLLAGHTGHPAAVQTKGEQDDDTVATGHVDAGPWRERSHRSSA